ncbi:MAG: NUDIX hydrolase [Allosphingosinicella sp.]|uniref:NUDIX hydrolase n=1 Tax=Allosphingosinicella sp. TaxID=2823234 RepID=UPI0039291BB4
MSKRPLGEPHFERPILTVDVVLLTLRQGQLTVVLATRAEEPFKGRPALLGGFVRVNSDVDADATVARVLHEKAGLSDVYVEQLRTFSGRNRDPRGWSASIAYIALLPFERFHEAAPGFVLRSADDPGDLPFDHGAIVAAARERLRTKGAYSTLPARLLPQTFTLPEMQQVYEAVTNERLDQSSFRRKIGELGAVEPVPGETRRSATVRRPAQLYRLAAPISLFDKKL